MRVLACALALAPLWLAGPAGAELPVDRPGQVAPLPRPLDPHRVWVTDVLLGRVALVDLDTQRMLGMLSVGYGPT